MTSISEINNRISELVDVGDISDATINTLFDGKNFFPHEGRLWDYKQTVAETSEALAKTVLQIVSFHNTYGGYLLFGVEEVETDALFVPCGFDSSRLRIATLRDKIVDYTGSPIDVHISKHQIFVGEQKHEIGLLYIPKRQNGSEPLSFLKDGPHKRNKPIFQRDTTYFRQQDQCMAATTASHFTFLFSARNLNNVEQTLSIDHNLPSKDMICPKFIGRDNVLSELWKWLGDEFEYTRVLSGEGGKGKTSIAYEFSQQIINNPPKPFERLLWLSLKEKQFSPHEGRYIELSQSDFQDNESFLQCLCDHFAQVDEEIAQLSVSGLKKLLKSNMQLIPSIVVVDNVDSLEDSEQKRLIDTCRQLGCREVRFLITTRHKHGFSSDILIEVPGLPELEHAEYVDILVKRHRLQISLNKSLYKKIHRDTDGSPLLTESVLRITKFKSLTEALAEWKGQSGVDAREAVLKKELDSLSPNAKRTLLTLFYFNTASFSELKNVLRFGGNKLEDAIEELESLFIVNEPKIIESEKRFSISSTTSLIVSERPQSFALDFQKLKKLVKEQNGLSTSRKKGNTRLIGAAINQSLALIKDGRIPEAVDTVQKQLNHYKSNPDLLLMKARCLISYTPGKYEEARLIIKESILKGQKKELAFDIWYQCEKELKNPLGSIECANAAIEMTNSKVDKWYEILAKSTLTRARFRGNITIQDLIEASSAMSKSVVHSKPGYLEDRVQMLESINDRLWYELEHNPEHGWIVAADCLRNTFSDGDNRRITVDRIFTALGEAKRELEWNPSQTAAFSASGEKLEKLLRCSDLFDTYQDRLKEII